MLLSLKKNQRSRINLKTPTIPVIILIFVIITGTVGYNFLWMETDSTIIDELYMTFITITTIGYNEIYPLDTTGRIFTIFIGVVGIGSLFYILTTFMENLVILQLSNYRGRKKIMRKIDSMSEHIILIGYGRVGKIAARELISAGEDFIIVDESFENSADELSSSDIIAVEGDAAEDETLLQANIKNAKGIIVTTASPSTTVFVVLSAKVLNPKLFIVARADTVNSVEKLKRAGADRIINPYSIGGQRLAHMMINPHMYDFIDSSFSGGKHGLAIEKFTLPENCQWIGKTLKNLDIRRHSGATIVAIIRDGKTMLNPAGNFEFKSGDSVIAMGERAQLDKIEELALGKPD